ncbi:hypothetical protein [Caballeronia telluris]|jgi:hypothetical protein|uniref:Uncharacterized protein n=1 Tax=Caballeronia telluris TaxID=326475 RepID=A0A158JHB8_9BURK|nr:hypothetical protein [Caballeronia telluris]SAL67843.1 hypothetical protein AWB66_04206 [Caballeronia telluris]
MMREVTGAFRGTRKLAEALDDLRALGIGGDRIRVDGTARFAVDPCAAATRDAIVATHWMNAEYAGHGEHLGVIDWHDSLFDNDHDYADPATSRFEAEIADDLQCMRVIVSIADDAEMSEVCDIFCRLGTADVDAQGVMA